MKRTATEREAEEADVAAIAVKNVQTEAKEGNVGGGTKQREGIISNATETLINSAKPPPLPPKLTAADTIAAALNFAAATASPPVFKKPKSVSHAKLELDAAEMLSHFQRASEQVTIRNEEREQASIRLANQVMNAGGPGAAVAAAAAAAIEAAISGSTVATVVAQASTGPSSSSSALEELLVRKTAATVVPVMSSAGVVGLAGVSSSGRGGVTGLQTTTRIAGGKGVPPPPVSDTIAVPGWGVALVSGVFSPHILDLDTRDRNTFLKAAGDRFSHFDAKTVLVKESRKHKQKSALVKFRAKAREREAKKQMGVEMLIAMGDGAAVAGAAAGATVAAEAAVEAAVAALPK